MFLAAACVCVYKILCGAKSPLCSTGTVWAARFARFPGDTACAPKHCSLAQQTVQRLWFSLRRQGFYFKERHDDYGEAYFFLYQIIGPCFFQVHKKRSAPGEQPWHVWLAVCKSSSLYPRGVPGW